MFFFVTYEFCRTSSSSSWRLWPRYPTGLSAKSTTGSGIFCRWTSRCRAVSRTCRSQSSQSFFWPKNFQRNKIFGVFWSFNSSEWKTKLKRTLSRQKGWIFFFSVETSFSCRSSMTHHPETFRSRFIRRRFMFRSSSGSQILQLASNDWNKTTWN